MDNNELKPIGTIKMSESKKFEHPEWCFQFNDNEPIVFGAHHDTTNGTDLTLTIKAEENSNIVFYDGENTFRIFARDITEVGKKIIEPKLSKNGTQDTI